MADTPELTDAEKLTALEIYMVPLRETADSLRAAVTRDMGARRVERVGAYLPDGEKIGAVAYCAGNVAVKVVDPAAALRWCRERYPDEIVQAVNPAFLKMLTEHAKKTCRPGDKGVDPRTGEELSFIEVGRGSAYVTVTKTEEGIERMRSLAHSFTRTLEGRPASGPYDPGHGDRLSNGAYE